MNHKIPLWLDCDPGHDDMMAIILAAYNPKIELLGISTVFGNTKIENTTKNALRVIEHSGIQGIDVVSGSSAPICPLSTKLIESEEIHGTSGLGSIGQNFPDTTLKALKKNAILHMYETIMASQSKVTIVTTGCMTNLALLLRTFPDIAENIEQISFMGGADFGNVTPAAEANIVLDPEAADIVCNSGIKVTMIPLEVTHTALITPEISKEILEMKTEYAQIIHDLLKYFEETYLTVFEMKYPPLHDPCAVAYIISPEIFTVKYVHVDIDRFSEKSKGRTVCDMFNCWKLPKNVHVTTKMDVTKFWTLMLDALKIANERSPLNKKSCQ